MYIRECNCCAKCVHIDKPCFFIHILYGWLVIFISFLIILRFFSYSFIHIISIFIIFPMAVADTISEYYGFQFYMVRNLLADICSILPPSSVVSSTPDAQAAAALTWHRTAKP